MDYGERKKRKPTRNELLVRRGGLAVMAAIAVATLVGMWVQRVSRQAGELPYWTVAGPPCPTVATVPATLPAPAITFNYADVDYARTYGNASCSLVPHPGTLSFGVYPVCQFNAPDVLKVAAGGKTALFLTGPGQGVTVSVKDGQIRCVLASHFH